jgi:polygalacturonase
MSPMKFFNLSAAFLLVLFAGCSKSSTSTSTTTNNSHVTTLSLVADGVTDNAFALQQSIDSCSNAGGGTLVLPAAIGEYMIGPIYMLSNVNLHLDSGATLLATSNMAAFTINGKVVDLIRSGSSSLTNVSITGGGTIDGNGQAWWTAFNQNPNLTRPRLVYITSCTNLTLDGITLQNSPSFHFVPYQCTNVIANNVTVLAPLTSPNTDGIDPSQCNGVTITNCTIDNGDDDIAIKAAGLCQNITVKHCTFKHGHGLSIGSETNGGMKGLTVDSCTFTGTTNGIRLKSYTSAGGPMTNLSYSNITMTGVTNPLIITLDYSNEGGGTTNVPSVNGFTINNLTATGSGNAGSLVGLSNSILQNITLSNINVSSLNNTPMIITDANNVTITNAIINGVTVAPGSGNIIATNVTGNTGF